MIFDEADARPISTDLELYLLFHAGRDLDQIVRWLRTDSTKECGQRNPNPASHSPVRIPLSKPRSNLPTIKRFFGRDTELAKLLPDLHPDTTSWGAH